MFFEYIYNLFLSNPASWFVAFTTLLVGIIALFKEDIIRLIYGPKIELIFSNDCIEDVDYGRTLGCAVSGKIDSKIIRLKIIVNEMLRVVMAKWLM